MEQEIEEVRKAMRSGSRISVITGAGVSVASGVPTFRGEEGLWKSYRPEELATPEAFHEDPKMVWEWYDWRRSLLAKCKPNRAHEVLAAWSGRFSDFTLITQNVDGLHEKCGTKNVLRFHGSIWEVRCVRACEDGRDNWWHEIHPLPEIPPSCPHCNGLIRPGVVWFGEQIDRAVLEASFESADCDVFLSIGTSSLVHPAASLLYEAKRKGALTVEINTDATASTALVDIALQGPADKVLDTLECRLVE